MVTEIKSFPLLVGIALLAAVGCESEEEEHGKPVPEEQAELREKAGLHPTERLDKQAQTPEELKQDLDVEPDEEPKPKTEAEIRDEMDLRPDSEGKLE